MTETRNMVRMLVAVALLAMSVAGSVMWWRARQHSAPGCAVRSVRFITATAGRMQYQAAVINETDTIAASRTLTQNDIARIYQRVMNDPRCDHRIIRIDDQLRPGISCDAVVMTGVVYGLLAGEGKMYYFVKTNGNWERLAEEGSWNS